MVGAMRKFAWLGLTSLLSVLAWCPHASAQEPAAESTELPDCEHSSDSDCAAEVIWRVGTGALEVRDTGSRSAFINAFLEGADSSGLEAFRPGEVLLAVSYNPDEDAGRRMAGLSPERIRTRAESTLRRNGLDPLEETLMPDGQILLVKLQLVGSAFSVDVAYLRPVLYASPIDMMLGNPDAIFSKRAVPVYERSLTGIHGDDDELVLRAVDMLLEEFLNAYLAANVDRLTD